MLPALLGAVGSIGGATAGAPSSAESSANVNYSGMSVGSGGKKDSQVPDYIKSALNGGQMPAGQIAQIAPSLQKWVIPAALVLGVVVLLAVKGR